MPLKVLQSQKYKDECVCVWGGVCSQMEGEQLLQPISRDSVCSSKFSSEAFLEKQSFSMRSVRKRFCRFCFFV